MPGITGIGYAIGGGIALICAIIGFFAGIAHRRKKAEAAIGSAEDEAKRILSDAIKNAEARKKENILEAKDEIHALRSESDKELRERRSEVQRQERRLQQKEEAFERKQENFEAKEEKLAKRTKDVEARLQEAEQLKHSQMAMLEKISGFTSEEAKAHLLSLLESELTHRIPAAM